ncbi:MAG TPA: VOC family protein [Thermomicrobiales bacterium]|nr:VOC family protein [Thermomicrobiales bacterium]
MSLALDHVLIWTSPGAPEADALIEAGFLEGGSRRHHGQGTANRTFFFENAYLEFIWVEDEAEARSELVQPLGIWERWRWRETGASPFGICVRVEDGRIPFATFDYRPPYIPAGASIPIASDTHLGEPLLFVNLAGGSPARRTGDARPALDHPNGARELTRIHLGLPDAVDISAALQRLPLSGWATIGHSPAPVIELSWDARRQGQRLDLQPELPLILHW